MSTYFYRSDAPLARKLRAMELAGAFRKPKAETPKIESFPIPDPAPFVPRPRKPPMKRSKRIFYEALDYFGIPEEMMISQSRAHELVKRRQIAMYSIYAETAGMESTVSICRMFNKLDHTTVVHAIQKVRELYEAGDEEVVTAVDYLRKVP